MRHVLPIYNKVGHAVDCNRDKMFRKLFLVSLFAFVALAPAFAQKKEISQAKSAIKAGKAVEAEASMRKLLADSAHRQNEKIWLVLFDAVKKQYEDVNEKMYLKQSTDTAKLFDAAYRMFGVLEALDSVDAMPDKDGRIKLKYRRKHADYLDAYRKNLYTGGSYFLNKQDYPRAFKLFAAYIDCASQPLFETQQYASRDKRLPSAAFYALYSGYRANDAAATLRYKQLAETDTARLPLTLEYEAETYRAQADSVGYLATLEKGFAHDPASGYFFPHLFDYRFQRGDTAQALDVCNRSLAVNAKSTVAMEAKSAVLLTMKRYDECVQVCDSVIAADAAAANAYLNAGLAYFNQAVKIDNAPKHTRAERAEMLALYRKSLKYMQPYRRLAPARSDLWAMPLYTIYLNLNMGKEFVEIDAIMKQKR